MNNAKLWLVVPPAVGVPVFLGAVAVGSFSVHVAVLSNTSWVSDFLSGVPMGTGDMETAAAGTLSTVDPNAALASFVVPGANGAQEILIVLPDGRTAKAVLTQPDTMALATATPPPVTLRQ